MFIPRFYYPPKFFLIFFFLICPFLNCPRVPLKFDLNKLVIVVNELYTPTLTSNPPLYTQYAWAACGMS